jgi:hypothetical protein
VIKGKGIVIVLFDLQNDPRDGSGVEMDDAGLSVAGELPVEHVLVECLGAEQVYDGKLDTKDMAVNPLLLFKSAIGLGEEGFYIYVPGRPLSVGH